VIAVLKAADAGGAELELDEIPGQGGPGATIGEALVIYEDY